MEMWRQYERNARRNATLTRELLRVLDRLDAAGIPALTYKGPLIAHQLFGDVALREFEDLDILVPAGDLARAKRELLADAYDLHDDLDDWDEASLEQSRGQYHVGFVHRETGVKLELHWRTDPEFPVERTEDPGWWAACDRVPLGGTPVRSFQATDLLLVLCLHCTKHQGHRLTWLVEIAELVRRGGTDWPAVMAFAESRQCVRRVLVALVLSEKTVGCPLPESIARASTADPAVGRMTDSIVARMMTADVDEAGGLERLRISLPLYDRPPQKLRHLSQVIFAPTLRDVGEHTLPRGWQFLYVPMRVFRLVGKYGAHALRKAAGRS